MGTVDPHLCTIHAKGEYVMALFTKSYWRYILIKRLEMPAGLTVFVHLLNKKTAIEPIPLMRKKEDTVSALFHLFLLIYRKPHGSLCRFYATSNHLQPY
jgi:hypothetical protein